MYSIDALLELADAANLPRSSAWIRGLIRDGLLDRPRIRGVPGQRGGRQPGTWPAEQYELLSQLVERLGKGISRKALCELPVSVWLDKGPGHVPVRQVRRALRYSLDKPSKRTARRTARELAELLAGGEDFGRRDAQQLVNAFVDVAVAGVFNRDLLFDAARNLTDPDETGRTIGPLGPWIGPDGLVWMIQAHLTAREQLDELGEEIFQSARLVCRQATTAYSNLQPRLSTDPEVGPAVREMSPERIQETPSQLVLTTLGVLALHRETGIPARLTTNPELLRAIKLTLRNNSPPRPR